MAGVSSNITIELKDDDLRRALERLEQADVEDIWRDVGESLINSTEERFRQQTGPDGERWPSVTAATRKRKKNPLILTESTNLRQISYEVSDGALLVGTRMVYGAAHQFGVDDPAQHYVTQQAKGVGRAHTRHMKIPARPYLGIDDDDEANIIETIRDYMSGAWSGKG